MSGTQLAQFQRAAVDHIVARLSDRQGSQRMLLADEVGLGKTIVARGVIESLMTRRKGPLTVVYLCSNSEIADQNRTKLDPSGGRSVGRVTELALDRSAHNPDLLLYSFTPGTSLRGGTGLAWERRLLLYLIHRIHNEAVWNKRWRNFFRCGAGEEGWAVDTTERALRDEFERKTSRDFQAALAAAWRLARYEAAPVIPQLRDLVADFNPDDRDKRTKRNAVVAALRGMTQRVALRHIVPHLVILDEVQRFRDVLDAATQSEQIASELFAQRVPVLILSATPYRALTLGHELDGTDGGHHSDFFKTLDFLFNEDSATPDRIRKTLSQFGQRLQLPDPIQRSDEQLLMWKRSLEADLRKVICRTERNWYVLDRRKGIEEVGVERRAMPRRTEIEEYLRLHRALGPAIGSAAQVTEFWKSAPSLLTFLDARYALLRRLRDERTMVPRSLLAPASKVHGLADRNHRIQSVVDHSLGGEGRRPHLWTAPSYKYYRDQFFGDTPPRKLLVFSGWRFVPKTVAIVTSRVASDRLGLDSEDHSQPLAFSDRRSFHVFDVCFPTPALASMVNFRPNATRLDSAELEAHDVLEATFSRLREEFADAGITVLPSGGAPTWQVVARFEQRRGFATQLRRALNEWQPDNTEAEPSAAITQHREWVSDWLSDNRTTVQINEARLRRLALVATFSPANAIWRSLASVYGTEAAEKAYPQIAALSLGAMRRYFNRSHVQQAIRLHEPLLTWPTRANAELGYAERALLYAGDAHLQAVLDEYIYLQRHAAQAETVGKAVEQLEAIWTLSRGSPRTNGARGHASMVTIEPDAQVHATHFALAFGDDVSRDAGPDEEDEKLRKNVVREAFNSPFWPFVLSTTSVGQEGLDFHLYCRDILHWNLPSNPVDLEQREGRINRRDCLAVRSSIARDWPISNKEVSTRLERENSNVWQVVFDLLDRHDDPQRYKHGLYPHWIYECRDPTHTVRIQRHVPFFATSRDAAKYERLKTGLALYRLVFGQSNQEDLLERLQERIEPLPPPERDRIFRRLAGYMLNLSPIGHEQALKHAAAEADALLTGSDCAVALEKLLADVIDLRDERSSELADVSKELDDLVHVVRDGIARRATHSNNVHRAVSALAYLRNPYDHIFDLHVEGGFADDVNVIRNTWRNLTSGRRDTGWSESPQSTQSM